MINRMIDVGFLLYFLSAFSNGNLLLLDLEDNPLSREIEFLIPYNLLFYKIIESKSLSISISISIGSSLLLQFPYLSR
jgi:hypothetical protein